MTIKMKLAALAALTALATSAFAGSNLEVIGTLQDADLNGAEAQLVAVDSTLTALTAAAGNLASITQVTGSNLAYVEQTADVGNIAIVSQSVADDNSTAIYQAGSANRALVYQH